ncbi:MAG: MmcQ/YjbR family DNA-binding protein [candidate division Zixibacteria bacterium]|nr:MmcQ/YjbR family DNA-binding protein [candidate division Zixibacteria bacterium]
MRFAALHKFCVSFPGATEDVQWENDLLFRVGGKIFAIVGFNAKGPQGLCFKCTPQKFAELTKKKGIIPAPYVARYYWVALENLNALRAPQIKALIKESYQMVYEKLPGKLKSKVLAAKK